MLHKSPAQVMFHWLPGMRSVIKKFQWVETVSQNCDALRSITETLTNIGDVDQQHQYDLGYINVAL